MAKPKRKQSAGVVRVGVDTGGTFTDFVVQTRKGVRVFKLASTPADPSQAIIEGLRRIADEEEVSVRDTEIVHGTTVGTNALLERRGARTAFVTTAGFEDTLHIGRQTRPALYDLNVTRPPALIESELSFGVRERVGANGAIIEELDEAALEYLIEKLKRERVEAIAVSLIFSFAHPEHERRIERALLRLGVPLSISHRILPEYREYERASTVAANAYLQPLMKNYMDALQTRAPRLRVMQSSGGSLSARAAADEPVRTILSGPAGGVVGAIAAARAAGISDIITFDMGGTSTDVALCAGGRIHLSNEATVTGLPVAVPALSIHTVGAGGGSIARVDAGGSLRVGPESAGAVPGPACYGRGGHEATVTDANLVLNRFGGAQLLGGAFALDKRAAQESLTRLAGAMSTASNEEGGKKSGRTTTNITAREAALGVVRVVNAGMERALRRVSIERGYDPRFFTLVSFGGAGGLHAVELARALHIPRVFVPANPGTLSALGALRADVVRDTSRTVMIEARKETNRALESVFDEMEASARRTLSDEGFDDMRQRHERTVAARYKGQSFELEIEWKGGASFTSRFHALHEARYGYARDESVIEIVSARVRSIGLVRQPRERRLTTKNHAGQTRAATRMLAPHDSAPVYFTNKTMLTHIYRRDELPHGVSLRSPCIVTEYSSTTLVPSGAHARTDERGNLIIEL